MEGSNKNENQGMENEEIIIFVSETKFEEEMKGIEENASLKIESNKVVGINEKKIKLKKKNYLQIWNNCIFEE
jgi:hypothetical protein